jgi:hypothetical protein
MRPPPQGGQGRAARPGKMVVRDAAALGPERGPPGPAGIGVDWPAQHRCKTVMVIAMDRKTELDIWGPNS